MGGGQAHQAALQVDEVGDRRVSSSGVRTISSTISRITGTVRCPMSEARPRPTMNPMAAYSSIHSPAFTISEIDGDRKWPA